MSITKRVLFGQIEIPKPSKEDLEYSDRQRLEHERMNDLFVTDFFDEWSSKFSGMTIPQIYKSFRYLGYAKSYYSKLSAELGGKHELLKFLLVASKIRALSYIGCKPEEIKKILEPFQECGRYMVSYKNSSLTFTTTFNKAMHPTSG